MKTNILTLLTSLLLLTLTAGCDSESAMDDPDPQPEVQMAEDIPADPFVGFDAQGRPLGAGKYTFFSLRENRMVAEADSASTAWDIALKGTAILTNGGTSGPGAGGAQIIEGVFEEITEAPADGYVVDGPEGPAIPVGSGGGWYNYNPQANLLTPIPGRVLMIRTADGRYAKMRILSYYKGAPEVPDANTDEARYVTFEFIFQPDGSRSFQ